MAVEALAKRRVTVYGGAALRLYHEGRSGFYEAVVRIDGSGRCSCPGGVTGHVCKHMLAAWALLALYRVSSAAGQAFPARFYVSEARSLEEGGGPGAEAAEQAGRRGGVLGREGGCGRVRGEHVEARGEAPRPRSDLRE